MTCFADGAAAAGGDAFASPIQPPYACGLPPANALLSSPLDMFIVCIHCFSLDFSTTTFSHFLLSNYRCEL
jgi:hypothetical protein